MKFFKKTVSAILCGAVIAASFVLPAAAKTFPDVEGDATVSWAKDAINSMTDLGYIKGYDDGTFKPQRAISKIESLLLMSRIMGVDEEDYAMSVNWANTEYGATVKAINTQYPNELCYLMYLNVLSVDDLRNYASSANADASLLRWQAAYLMSKLTGNLTEAETASLDPALYSDYDKIPEGARSYVAYANNMGLMKGMGKDDNGKDYFSPDTTLTRAQMATLLDRVIDGMGRTNTLGVVESIDTKTGAITVSTTDGRSEGCEVDKDTLIKVNGASSGVADIREGDDIMITFTYDDTRLVEVIPGKKKTQDVAYGIISQFSDSAGVQKIIVRDSEIPDSTITYTLSGSCVYDLKGTRGTYKDLKLGDSVRLVITGSEVTEVHVTDRETTRKGTFIEIQSEGSATNLIFTNEDGNEESLKLSINNVEVTRNGHQSNLRDLNSGDTMDLNLLDGKVTAITAKSDTTTVVGTIKEIILSDKPEITLEADGKSRSYYMSTNTAVKVNKTDGTIYDLRPGASASVEIDGNTIVSIESDASGSYGKNSITGKVQTINTTLKVITVVSATGGTETIYYNSDTTVLTSDGKTAKIKDITDGSNISATGSDSTGYFVATIIIVG